MILLTRPFAAALLGGSLLAPVPPAHAQTAPAARETGAPAAKTRPAPRQRGAKPEAQEGEEPAARGAARGAKPAASASRNAAPPGIQASPVAAFGDWNVFAAGQGRTRICYAITQPKARLPKTLNRDPAYLFVTVRKADNVSNEIALILGFAAKASGGQTASAGAAGGRGGADPVLTIGSGSFPLVVKDANAWLQNPAEEGKVVGEMGRAQKLVVKAASLRGNASTDEYSLAGFGDAMKRTREECK